VVQKDALLGRANIKKKFKEPTNRLKDIHNNDVNLTALEFQKFHKNRR
jgi:hypothetical protein